MEENLLWKLIARKLSGEASSEEIEQLNDVLLNNPHGHVTYEALLAFWEHPVKESTPDNLEELFNTHLLATIHQEDTIDKEPAVVPFYKRIFSKGLFKAAAVITVVLGIALISRQLIKPGINTLTAAPIKETQKIETTNGTKTNTILPDGSKVWLNSGSKLTYKTFNNSMREVILEGEAYFDVIKDAKRPFIVHTDVIDIRVLGTAFNVKSYANEKTVEASLVRGLIEVTRLDKPDKKVLLHPNEKITVLKKALSETAAISAKVSPAKATIIDNYKITGFTYSKTDRSVIETSWTDNKLAFEDMRFEELAVLMERWYGIKVVFSDEKAKNILFSGSFVNETISDALEGLKLSGHFNYKINNNEIEITANK